MPQASLSFSVFRHLKVKSLEDVLLCIFQARDRILLHMVQRQPEKAEETQKLKKNRFNMESDWPLPCYIDRCVPQQLLRIHCTQNWNLIWVTRSLPLLLSSLPADPGSCHWGWVSHLGWKRNESMGILPIIRNIKFPMEDSVLPIWSQTRKCALIRNITNNDMCTMAHGVCRSLEEIMSYLFVVL